MSVEFDAMTQDVGIGGLRSKYSIRVLLCYLLKHFNSKISRTAFIEILRKGELVNFFEINPALDSLTESGLIELIPEEDDDYFRITPDGIKVADKLETDIPLGTREKAVNIAVGIVAREKLKGTVDYKIEQVKDGYLVIMTVMDDGEIMMQTKLYAADYLQAQQVGENFMNDPHKLYNGIIDAITC